MPEGNSKKNSPPLSKSERVERLICFCIFFAVCFVIVAIFDTEWVTNILGCFVVGVGGCELNGIRVLPSLSRSRKNSGK